MDGRRGKRVMANPKSSTSAIGIVCKCGKPVDIIPSSGDRFRRHTICHDVSVMKNLYYVLPIKRFISTVANGNLYPPIYSVTAEDM